MKRPDLITVGGYPFLRHRIVGETIWRNGICFLYWSARRRQWRMEGALPGVKNAGFVNNPRGWADTAEHAMIAHVVLNENFLKKTRREELKALARIKKILLKPQRLT